jgi:urea transporter
VLDLINAALRGAGQVMFMNNPVVGFLISAALLYQSLYSGVLGLAGLVAATLMAKALALDNGCIRSGLFGFNGYLVGLALGTFDQGSALTEWRFFYVIIPVMLISSFSTIIAVALGNLLAPVYSVPSFTLPFNVAAILFLATAMNSRAFPMPFSQGLLPDASGELPWSACLNQVANETAATVDGVGYAIDWLLVLEAVPKGVGQVCSPGR